MSMVYQVIRSAGPNRPEYARAEVVAPSEPILSRKNEKIPWDIATMDPGSGRATNDALLQSQIVPLDNITLKNWFTQRNRGRGQPEWTLPPFGQSFKNQNETIRSLYQGTNENLTVQCPLEDQERFAQDISTEIEYFNSTDEACRECKEWLYRDRSSKKDKPKSPKESPREMLRRLLHEKVEKGRGGDDVNRDVSSYDMVKSRKQKFFQNLNEEILDMMKKEKLQYLENIAANNNRLKAIRGGSRFAMGTDPECDYPRWVRYLYRLDQKEIGQHIVQGMGVMDCQTDPNFEQKMAAVRGAILSGHSYGPSAARSARPMPSIYFGARPGTGAGPGAGGLAIQELRKYQGLSKKQSAENRRFYAEQERSYNSLMERGIVDCKLMRYIDKSTLLDLAKIRRNSKNIFPDTHSSVDEYSLDIAERFLYFEKELMKDKEYKFDMQDYDPWGFNESKEDEEDDHSIKSEHDSEKVKDKGSRTDSETNDHMSDLLNVSTPAQPYRKFDLGKFIHKKDKIKKVEKKSKLSFPFDINRGLPKFLPSEPNYPTNRDQDEFCMLRFRELLDNRGDDHIPTGWRCRLLAKRLVKMDCNK